MATKTQVQYITIIIIAIIAIIWCAIIIFILHVAYSYDGDSDPNMNKKDLQRTICEFIYNGYFDGNHCLMKTDAV